MLWEGENKGQSSSQELLCYGVGTGDTVAGAVGFADSRYAKAGGGGQ